jgi:zona occludens toxin
MAINVYCGVMGSGKSYEVTSGPLLDAVAAGRRVVTNIDGVNEDLIHAYLHEKRGLPVERLGRVVHVRTDDLNRAGFFPVEVEGKDGATVTPGFVLPGDMLVIDEAWKLWSQDQKISREHMAFFRMHRHFVHAETGVACDVVLMIQSIADLHRSLKAVVELSFRMVKLKSLGLNRTYRVEMYETSKQNRSTLTGTFVRKYKAEIFPLYKSYAGAAGTESTVDGRQNILSRKLFWVIGGVALIVGAVGLFFALRFFHPHAAKAHGSGAGSAAAASGASGAVGSAAGGSFGPKTSTVWRVAGGYSAQGHSWVLLADGDGRLRVESPGEFIGSGIARVGFVEGERVTQWSGQPVGGGPAPAAPGAGLVGAHK